MARQFNGTSDTAASTAALALSTHNKITLAGWLYWDTFASDNRTLFEYDSTYPVGAFYVTPNHSSSGRFMAGLRGNVGYTEASAPRPTSANWHHIMITMDRTLAANEVGAIYINGTAQTLTRPNNADNSDNFGSLILTLMKSGTLFSAGRLADWGIWTSVLTAANATSLSGGALTTSIPTNLFASWRMSATGTTEPDASGNGRTLTYTGTTVVADPSALSDTTPPTVVSRTVNGSSLVITYNEALNPSFVPATLAYTVMVSAQARGVSSVAVSGSTVTLTLATPVSSGETVTVSYAP